MHHGSTMRMVALTAGCLFAVQVAWADGPSRRTLDDVINSTGPLADASATTAFAPMASSEDEPASKPAVPPAADEEAWWFQPSIAIWLPGIDGTVGVRGLTTSVSASFTDILDNSDSLIGITGTFDFGKGRLGGYISGSYMKIGVDTGPNGAIDITNSIALLEFGVSYDVARVPMEFTATAERAARDLVVQLRLGARYTGVDVDATFPVIGSRSEDEDWVDPMLGGRVTFPFHQNFSVVVGGEIGGFGAASEFAWAASALFSWDFHLGKFPSSLQFGYLAVGDNYSHGTGANEFVWDTTLHGPVLNWSIRF